ncbi:alpha-L-fucosidase [Bacillus sp. FJAT-28004]|uniref:alpha-L-fucosidase n=1 Tax=Bacillus sp. FJAT-28004 TaxID=1679165 RepID=UPI0006B5E87B|nr:alpha-L-fucosidase [Bacillus sp. FJAT-28004]
MTADSNIKPTPKQLEYQSWEFGLFVHFGLRTFYEGYVDFDPRGMSPDLFNPQQLDCEQWIRTAKEAGMNYAVLTAKHHDGFSNWPSQYSSFSTKQSPWKDGKGDVVREFVEACRKYDVKPGLYYSPFDGSADFYNQDAKAYDDYFVNQITELLGQYGEIDILWFDGCGSEDHEYDWKRIIGEIRRLQPNILIFNMGDPDFRWVGNEDGIAPIPCWNVVDSLEFSIMTEEKESLPDKLWLPAECDVQMRANWFYSDSDEHTVKSLDQLMGLYYYSVGRGTNLLLNIGPDRQGLLPSKDVSRLAAMGAEIRSRFDNPIATLEQCIQNQNEWVYEPAHSHMLDHIVIQEDLSSGEHILNFQINIMTEKSHRTITVYEGQNIGHKAIVRFPPVKVRSVSLTVTKAKGEPSIKELSFYYVGEIGN